MGGGSAGAQTRVLSCVNLQPNSPAQQGTYADDKGSVLEKDKPVVKQKIQPLDEKLIASVDFKSRGAATRGTLRVLSADEAK